MITRSSGILMHITSLPSPYGIGTFGKEAYDFVDFLVRAGQKYWQMLPLGPTGYGDSPYQSFSTFSGNPYMIDFEMLVEEDLLERDDFASIDFGEDERYVDFGKIYENKIPVLRKAFERRKGKYKASFRKFKKENRAWLEDYGLYMAVKSHFGLKSWVEWDEDIKLREEKAMKYYQKKFKEDIDFWQFLQFLFFKQWMKLKKYANKKGIRIIGDIPVYVAEDSADTWANSDIFMLDEKKAPIKVSGCPPDAFSKTGQLWGNPIYRWDILEKRNYDWWIERILGNRKLYDVIRLDHFRGFESYWEIPYGEKTAVNGKWVKGPGMKLFRVVQEALGPIDIIAEDLGFLTEEVIEFREESGYPGMKVLQFAFDTREESDYLPHNYNKNCVVYTGTHDNDTAVGWLQHGRKKDVAHAIKYLQLNDMEGHHWGLIRGAWSSVGDLAVAQMQDFLGLGSDARMNIPSTIGSNWKWRARKEEITMELADRIREITKLYGR